ncbi:MAG: OmpH family outer membrane protein [Proteobacteria bacterium]|nr:OmpH family outer membrane protein [Pseudomonadota bacterium]
MRNKWMTLCAVVLLFAGISAAQAADVAKIGLVDLQRILDTSAAGKAATEEIQKSGEKMEAELKAKGQEIGQLRQDLDRQAMVMSREAYMEKAREIRIRTNDFKEAQQLYADDFKRQEAALIAKIKADVYKIVEEMGKKEGYTMILEKKECGAMYAPDALDITDRIIAQYDKSYQKK